MVFNTILQAGSQPTSLRPGANYNYLPVIFRWKYHIQEVMFSLLFATDKKKTLLLKQYYR